jgi:hypothetical protein
METVYKRRLRLAAESHGLKLPQICPPFQLMGPKRKRGLARKPLSRFRLTGHIEMQRGDEVGVEVVHRRSSARKSSTGLVASFGWVFNLSRMTGSLAGPATVTVTVDKVRI